MQVASVAISDGEVEDVVGEGAEVIKAMDITFTKDGEKIEPEKKVSVTFTSKEFKGLEDASVVHIDGDGDASKVGCSNSGTNVSFKASDFTVYAVVKRGAGEGTVYTVNFRDRDGQVIDLDKLSSSTKHGL